MLYKNFFAIVAGGGGGHKRMSRYILKASEVGVIIAMTLLTVLILSPTVCSTFNASANYQSESNEQGKFIGERASNIVSRISVSGI